MASESKNGQVILIQAHKNKSQLCRLISYFRGECDIFIHIDKTSAFTSEDIDEISGLPGVRKVYRKYSVHWAGFSILQCEIFLLQEALKHSDGTYFHLLSGQDYPLRPLSEFLHHFFHEVTSDGYISNKQMPHSGVDDSTFYRFDYFVFTDYIQARAEKGFRLVHRLIDWQKKLGIKRRIPDQVPRLYGGSAWFSISRRSAKYLVDYTRNSPALYRRMRFTFYPEESYVGTVLMNSGFSNNINNSDNLRFIYWNKPGRERSPVNLTVKHLERILKNSTAFFARKLEYPESEPLMELIDRYMLEEPSRAASDTGCWQTRSFSSYTYDRGLSDGLLYLCRTLGVKTVLDLGCGPGYYVSDLQRSGIAAIGYDGNPNTEELSALVMPEDTRFPCGQADVTEELTVGHPYDMVLFTGVGEYIPVQHEDRVLRNLAVCTGRYLVVNWASDGGGDERIVNAMDEGTLVERLGAHGFTLDRLATRVLRDHARSDGNRKRVTVFQK